MSMMAPEHPQLCPSSRPLGSLRAKPDDVSASTTPVVEETVAAPVKEPFQLGVKVQPALTAVAVGLLIRFGLPIPEGLTIQAWTLLSIFVTTIFGLVLDPMPVGAWAFLCVTATIATKTLTFGQAFGALTMEIIWLIVVSFFFAKGFEKTGLGERIAQLFVRALGGSTLGLSYGLNVAEAVLAPAMPSTSARAGGIFVPVIKSLSAAAGSMPEDDSRKRMGSYLIQSQLQTGIHSSNLFLTASAQNILCINLAGELGAEVHDPFFVWMVGALPPALAGIALTPLLMYKLLPPGLTATPEAPQGAARRLEQLGPMRVEEKLMLGTMGFAVVLWVLGDRIGVSTVLAAMLGLSLLLITGVLTWRDCLTYTPAWDTLIWFAVLIGMSSQLNALGVVKVFADLVSGMLLGLHLGWLPVFGLLHVAFYLLHYLFASQTAHVGALYSAFCAMMLAAGAPPVLTAMSLAYNVNLFGSMTHYASGQAAVYYGSGFPRTSEIFSTGAVAGLFGMLIWSTVGMAWWKVLGWW